MDRLLVQWSSFPGSLTAALTQLQRAGELADVTLACEGRHILAHKLVLSACSPYFRDAFNQNPCHHPIVILKDVRAQIALDILSYMYNGEVDIDEDDLPSFVQTAELLQVKGLSQIAPKESPPVKRKRRRNSEQQPTNPPAPPSDEQLKIKREEQDTEEIENENVYEKNPDSPGVSYENSMLARSLISGAQVLKNDNNSNIMPKLAAHLTNPCVTISRKPPPAEEPVVKTEKLSPSPEGPDLEPEIVISERDDSGANRKCQTVRSDQAGPSTAQGGAFGQTNHAAICGDCPHCGTKYSNQSALKYHVRLMHSDLTNRLCCYLCPRSFTMRDTFKEHMWTLHGQRN